MRRVYKFPQKDYSCRGEPRGLLANGFGSYFCFDESLSYQGWYLFSGKDWRMQKILESIVPMHEGDVTTLFNQFYGYRREFESGAQDTVIPYQKSLLYATTQLKGRVKFVFDGRESYEGSRMGREYRIEQDGDYAFVFFTQHGDAGVEYEYVVALKGVKNMDVINKWFEKNYSFDEHRDSRSLYWVYEGFSCEVNSHMVISVGSSKSEARTLADIAYFHFEDIVATLHERANERAMLSEHIHDVTLQAADACAVWSLFSVYNKLTFRHNLMPGIFAGLPWFYQLWSRDELISLGGLIVVAQRKKDASLFEEIKSILHRHLHSVQADGLLPNRFPHSDLPSIDALGWLARRIKDFLRAAKKEKQLYLLFTPTELVGWSMHLQEALAKAKEHHSEFNLFSNDACETWMDTEHMGDDRAGVRVEIQALFYAVYDAIIYIEKLVNSPYVLKHVKAQTAFKKTFRDTFVHPEFAGLLVDGLNDEGHIDKRYRPNVFLAAYLAPDLLSNKEWKKVFDVYLEKLYEPWGGLTTLNRDNSLFQPVYTGENNKSYHRGDSWYFVNNFAALVLAQVDYEKYKHYIKSIAHASAKDILELGLAGHHSEVSSATFQEAEACLAQAWSTASFVEFLEQLYPSDFY